VFVFVAHEIIQGVIVIHLRFGKLLASLLCVFCLLVSFSSQASAVLTPLNDDTMFVEQVYLDFLNREADSGGLNYWIGELDSGLSQAEVVEQYLLSPEFQGNIAPVSRLYFAYFDRIPDYDGLMYWVGEFGPETPLGAISDAFAGSDEFIATYGSLNNEAFVNLVYQNVLVKWSSKKGHLIKPRFVTVGIQLQNQQGFDSRESSEAVGYYKTSGCSQPRPAVLPRGSHSDNGWFVLSSGF
jgi:hypothetical protein